jgi:hypothetical protein
MDWQNLVHRLVGDKMPAVVVVLLVLFVIFSIEIAFRVETKELWVLLGIIALLLLLLTNQRGATVFLTAMVVGTLIAREDFLLKIAALSRGTSYSDIMKSGFQSAGQSDVQLAAEVKTLEQKKQETRNELASEVHDDKKQQVKQKLEEIDANLVLAKDAATLSTPIKNTVLEMATKGPISENDFKRIMDQSGIPMNIGVDDLTKQLIEPKYAETGEKDERLHLTAKGIDLAKRLGVKNPVSQK